MSAAAALLAARAASRAACTCTAVQSSSLTQTFLLYSNGCGGSPAGCTRGKSGGMHLYSCIISADLGDPGLFVQQRVRRRSCWLRARRVGRHVPVNLYTCTAVQPSSLRVVMPHVALSYSNECDGGPAGCKRVRRTAPLRQHGPVQELRRGAHVRAARRGGRDRTGRRLHLPRAALFALPPQKVSNMRRSTTVHDRAGR